MTKTSEQLFTCKICKRGGFTEAGLKRHNCKAFSPSPSAEATAQGQHSIVATDQVSNDAIMGEQLTEQYRRAIGGIVEVLKFGAMMMRVRDHSFSGKKSGNGIKGDGLKGWLTEFAPAVNLSTAYRFMALAEGAQEEFALGKKADLHLLLTAPDEELGDKLRKKKSAIMDFIEGKSQRQLLLAFGNESSNGRGGHHPRRNMADLTAEEKQALALENMRKQSVGFAVLTTDLHDHEEIWKATLSDHEIQLLADEVRNLEAKMRAWLKVPQNKRTRVNVEAEQ